MMPPELIPRARCMLCHGTKLVPAFATPPMPLFQGCVDTPASEDLAFPMRWEACETCGAAQLAELVPLEIVYQGGHATGLGKAWDAHNAAFAGFVAANRVADVLEVGGGGGRLARAFRASNAEPVWHILEPNPLISGDPIPNLKLARGFFDESFSLPEGVRTLVFCHSLEHMYKPREIVNLLGQRLPRGGRVLVAWPDLAKWLARGEPGAVNWEHSFYCPVDNLVVLFRQHGFRLAAREAHGAGHSVFLAFERDGAFESATPFAGGGDATLHLVREYFATFQRKVEALNRRVTQSEAPVYVAPASIYSQYLFTFGLDQSKIKGLLDNSLVKQGRRLYGTRMQVFAPAVMEGKPALILLNGGAHHAEMTAGFRAQNPAAEVLAVSGL